MENTIHSSDGAVSGAAVPVAIIMGSRSDWPTMREAASVLDEFKIPYRAMVVSAHRTPDRLVSFATNAAASGYKVIIAGAGGAAHLPGMTAAMTELPVLAVPVMSHTLNGVDSLLSIVQMPRGVAVGTQAIGGAGAFNAGLLATQILALGNEELAVRLREWRARQTRDVPVEVE
ncbi:5-(carboxyamino)imidazole ribonucleotide mutase [Saccharophagus sp. K07]|jgi:5-(carboxyamino)imidazole ribonucleotide mutase|uniref:5-(carboxyamino)imidazole ribonucleotide mutase n=1 Tax=Saccharophagus sp. K07 TaxID=2283636 RepID=UPI0016521876|nr:5-(carboxyamino)imidazole ribonucleotide mutase [Saccharophagus sp. K07]MBC6905107.1 5-(carboxyamino)imidazole ribonucleotide mutase [Saccharophagus sp. K07]